MGETIDARYYEQEGRERYRRWKDLGGARPAWLDSAIRNGGIRLTDWEPAFFAAYMAEHGDKQPKTPPLPHPAPPEPGKGKGKGSGHPHPSKPPQGDLPLGKPKPRPGDEQPIVPPLPNRPADDAVLPDE